MSRKRILFISTFLLLSGLASLTVSADLVMSAPPREKPEVGEQVYGPVADYISRQIGQKVVYRHPGEWGIYQADMLQNKYDIVFDGPHFVAWRAIRKGHEILATTPGELVFVVAVKSDNKRARKLEDLRGHTICGLAPPNLATLTLFREIGAGREPRLVLSRSFGDAFKKMLEGKCDGVVLRNTTYSKLAKESPGQSRVVFESKPLPNQAITASKRLDVAAKELLKSRLLSDEANASMKLFIDSYTGGKGLKQANAQEYQGLEVLLKDIWGFGI